MKRSAERTTLRSHWRIQASASGGPPSERRWNTVDTLAPLSWQKTLAMARERIAFPTWSVQEGDLVRVLGATPVALDSALYRADPAQGGTLTPFFAPSFRWVVRVFARVLTPSTERFGYDWAHAWATWNEPLDMLRLMRRLLLPPRAQLAAATAILRAAITPPLGAPCPDGTLVVDLMAPYLQGRCSHEDLILACRGAIVDLDIPSEGPLANAAFALLCAPKDPTYLGQFDTWLRPSPPLSRVMADAVRADVGVGELLQACAEGHVAALHGMIAALRPRIAVAR